MEDNKIAELLRSFEDKLKDQIEGLVRKLFGSFESKIQSQLDAMMKQQATMQKSLDRLDQDVGEDRKDISDISFAQNKINQQQDEIRALFGQQTQKIKETVKDAVEDGVSPMKKNVEDIKKTLEEVNDEP